MKRILGDGTVKNVKVKSNTVVNKKDHWTNEAVRIVQSIKCYVPKYIINVMKALDNKFSNSEFSIFGIIDYNKLEGQFELDSKYYIPKQKVSGASVNYEEDAPEGFNMVIHKHPRGCRSFSSTDDTYINQNFDYSLLWEGGKFVSGQVRINTDFGKVKISLDVLEESDELMVIPQDQLGKITENRYVVQYGKYGKSYKRGNSNYYDGEDYTDYLYGGYGCGGYGNGKNNSSLTEKYKCPPQTSKKIKKAKNFTKGSLLTSEQEEVNNYLEAQQEELVEYLEDIDVIMAEGNIGWEEAEKIYMEEHKDTIHKSLLDFNDPNLGTDFDIASESEDLRGV